MKQAMAHFDFYGYIAEFESKDFNVMGLLQDFLHFQIENESATRPELQKRSEAAESITVALEVDLKVVIFAKNILTRKGVLFAKTRMCEVRQISIQKRQLFYTFKGKPVVSIIDEVKSVGLKKKRCFYIEVADEQFLEEVLFFAVLSSVGESLDSRGMMRLHAAAVSLFGRNFILAGPSKAGKSTLANFLLQTVEAKIFSDELVVLDLNSKKLLPFPIRRSLEPKTGVDSQNSLGLSFFRQKENIAIEPHQLMTPGFLSAVFLLRSGSKAQVGPTTFLGKLEFFWQAFWGLGVIQMWEFFLRPNNMPALFRIAWNRIQLLRFLTNYRHFQVNRFGEEIDNLEFTTQRLKELIEKDEKESLFSCSHEILR